MKIQVVKIGKPSFKEYSSLVAAFEKRLRPVLPVDHIEIKATHGTEKSAKTLLHRLNRKEGSGREHVLVCLDERGATWNSTQFSKNLQSWLDDSQIKSLTFLIGGPYGIHEDVKQSADHIWSLSRLVFPSDLAWLIVWEQLYRASTIMRGMSYHHE